MCSCFFKFYMQIKMKRNFLEYLKSSLGIYELVKPFSAETVLKPTNNRLG